MHVDYLDPGFLAMFQSGRREQAAYCPAGLFGGLDQLLQQPGLARSASAGKQEQV
jgi:hypothetical protein